MAKLKPGALIVDLVGGGIYGDLDHCPKVDLLESAEALLSLLPHVQHKGLWGISKSFDEDCYIYTANKTFKVPAELPLPERDMYRGPTGMGPSRRNTTVTAMTYLPSSRLGYFDHNWYSVLVGSVKDGHACEETEGIEDMGKSARDRHERWKAQIEANKPDKQLTFC